MCDKFVKEKKFNHIGTLEHIDSFLMCPMCLCVSHNYIFVADPLQLELDMVIYV